jgi:translation elongation factor EF-1alpha
LSRVAADMGGRVVTLLCVPGSSRSVRVASRGISQADVALLVVESNQLELDASLAKTGRATEHLLLALTFGITSVSSLLVVFFAQRSCVS